MQMDEWLGITSVYHSTTDSILFYDALKSIHKLKKVLKGFFFFFNRIFMQFFLSFHLSVVALAWEAILSKKTKLHKKLASMWEKTEMQTIFHQALEQF